MTEIVCVYANSLMDADVRKIVCLSMCVGVENCVWRDMRLAANCPTMVRPNSAYC